MRTLLVPTVTFLVATLPMAAIVKVNATVLKFIVTRLLDVKVIHIIILSSIFVVKHISFIIANDIDLNLLT